jgi:MoaA/NifB/PqqE/SkfB family radical SAM enzyme
LIFQKVLYVNLTVTHYLTNLVRLLRGDRLLQPLVVSYCVSAYCNLNCRYCEDFGARRNPAVEVGPLPLADARRVLSIIRPVSDSLILTGGEPLLYPGLEALIAYARRDLRFRRLTLLTNGLLLPNYQAVLGHVQRLVVSLDTVDPDAWDQTLRAAPGTGRAIIDAIAAAARRQAEAGFRLVVHCVVTPETLGQAQAVLDFCVAHGVVFSFSPQSVNNWPRYELLVSEAYRAFVARLIQAKRGGAPILGSLSYLRLMLNFEPYACYPLLAPRVMPDGALAYPCRPIERGGTTHGGREVNLLEAGTWAEAMRRAVALYGPPPLTCGSCYQQCYVEPSLMQARPLALLRELVAFAPSRRASIYDYAPG